MTDLSDEALDPELFWRAKIAADIEARIQPGFGLIRGYAFREAARIARGNDKPTDHWIFSGPPDW